MKKTMRYWNAVAFLLCTVVAHQGLAESGSFVLVRDRAPTATFVLTAEQAGLVASNGIAAGMLDDFNADLHECAGCELPVSESDAGADQVIRFAIETRTPEDEDRFAITFPDERTMLITGSTVSLRWALNHILQEFAGVRYLFRSRDGGGECGIRNQDGAHFPALTDLIVPRKPMEEAPDWNLSRREAYNPWWNKRTGNFVYRVPCGHILSRVAFPVKEYMKRGKWPDFIFPVVNGERYLRYKDAGEKWERYLYGWQPCFTDDRVVEEAVKNITEYFDRNPQEAGVSMALNDLGDGFCECETCRPLIGEGRNMTRHRDYSEIYFQWANRVAEGVAKKHPDKYLGALAYRETLNPPGFKLHSNIVSYICYDICSCLDAQVRTNWEDLLMRWHAKADYLGRYEYGWGDTVYQMPRVYFKLQQEMMQADHANGARAIWLSGVSGGLQDGPKKYLYNHLLWDVNLDLDAVLTDWHQACVGKEAAPYLAEYFQVWERIWREEAVKTSWFQNSRNGVYLNMSNQSYLYAVGAGDLPKLRGLMERVVELAERHGDARQKKRAVWLMADFEYSEACIYAVGGHIFPPSGAAETAEQAVAYLKFLPEAVRYDARRPELHKKRLLCLLQPGFKDRAQPYVQMALAQVAGMASDAAVLAALAEAAGNAELPAEARGLLDVFVRMEKGEPVENLMLDGSFEKDNLDWKHEEREKGALPVELTGEKAHKGKNSLKFHLGLPHRSIISRHGRDLPHQRVAPGKYYASLMVRVDTENPDVESYVKIRATARDLDDKIHGAHFDSANVTVAPGTWMRISLLADVSDDRNSLKLDQIVFYNYSPDDTAYIDDVVVVPLGR